MLYGFGNQMFSYALYKALIKRYPRKKIKIDTSYFDQKLDVAHEKLMLNVIFPNVQYCQCTHLELRYLQVMTNIKKQIREKKEYSKGVVDWKYILGKSDKILSGPYISDKYFDGIECELHNDFKFNFDTDYQLFKLKDEIIRENSVSIHIRRGDYLDPKYNGRYTGICSREYYEKSIKYICNNIEDPVFYVFSDDVQWVKNNIIIPNAKYIEKDLFKTYQDWYDMALMSVCKHNIIANSTFSWWGAWLNPNMDKTVIVPSRWFQHSEAPDIYPTGWIKVPVS